MLSNASQTKSICLMIFICFVNLETTSFFSHKNDNLLNCYINCYCPYSWEGKEVKLIIKHLNQDPTVDTTVVFNGCVKFTVSLAEPTAAYIWNEGNNQDTDIFVDSPKINIGFDSINTYRSVISGSISSEIWQKQHKALSRLIDSQADFRNNIVGSLNGIAYKHTCDSLLTSFYAVVAQTIEKDPLVPSSWYLFASYYHGFSFSRAIYLLNVMSSFDSYSSYQNIKQEVLKRK